MSEIQEVADKHRQALRKNEANALKTMNTAFKRIEFELMERAQVLLTDLEAQQSVASFLRLRRTKELLADIDRFMGNHAQRTLRDVIISLAESALNEAQDHADELIRAALGPSPNAKLLPIASLSEAQIVEIVGTMKNGPLARLLDGFGRVAAEHARRELLFGVALGEHPSKVARRLRRSLNITNQRAYLIARTEQLRAYREGTRQFYDANKHIVQKWIWSASLSPRTCAACWALHGQEFDTNERMANHPACRCSMVPKTKTWKELGFSNVPESRPDFPRGTDLFDKQSESVKRTVLGPAAFDAYKRGDVKLEDFIHVDRSRTWGTTYRRGSLANALK